MIVFISRQKYILWVLTIIAMMWQFEEYPEHVLLSRNMKSFTEKYETVISELFTFFHIVWSYDTDTQKVRISLSILFG